jgi:hypothetical protein
MATTGRDSQLELVRGPAAAAAAIALTALVTAFLPPATVLADPPVTKPAVAKASPTPALPQLTNRR